MAAFFIRRPIVAIVIAIVTVIGGLVSLRALPVAQFPSIVPPQIIVSATYTGADAETIEQSVATPLEQQMNGVDDMLYMQSTNGNDGSMQLTVTFDIETDPNIDQVNVQNRVAQASPNLPTDVTQYGLTMRKSTGLPMMLVSLFSPTNSHDALFLANYANINIIDALYRVRGVGEVRVFGAGEYAMRIWLQPDRLAAMQLTLPEVAAAVRQQSTVNPAGQVGGLPVPTGQEITYTVRAPGRLQSPEEFGDIILRSNPDGSVVHLRDVARVELGALNYQQIGRSNGQPGVGIAVFQAPGSNALDVAAGIRQVMAELAPRFPEGVDYRYTLDTTLPVSEGIREIIQTLAEAMVLVILVVFLFLQNWRATLIPMLAVPVSLIGTFAVFPLLGFSVNTLSLFGLVLAIGLVVDDAIVVVEAVEHHIEQGLSPREATFKAMEEVSGPVIGIALILASVFIPVGVMGGIQGRLNQQFAITIAVSVLISAFNALTLSPALSALLLKPRSESRGWLGRFFARFNRWLERTTHGYVSLSHGIIRKPVIGLLTLAIFTGAAGLLGKRLPASFLPEEDYGYFLLNVQLPPAASLERTDATTRKIDELLKKTEGIQNFNTIVGFSLLTRVTASNNAFYFVQLTPWAERESPELHARAIVNRMNGALREVAPEAVAFAVMPPSIPGLGSQGGFTLWLQDRGGASIQEVDRTLQAFLAAARQRPELAGVTSPFSANVPQVFADVDREKVLRQGVALGDVYQTMQAYLGGLYVNQFNRFGRQWRVYLQADGETRTNPDQIGQYYVRNNAGTMVPLSSLQTITPTFGPQFTNRFNVYRAVQVNGTAAPGYSSGQAMAALEEVARETLPSTFSYDWADLSYQERKAEGTTTTTFGLSLIFVFLILAALYESWSLPFSVLLTVPIAVFGGFLGLMLRRMDLDVYGQIGIVMLIGLSAKNAILIVEFAKYRLEEGMPLVQAALEGARLRLRPILMTSFAFILGCVPLWRATGSGAAARRILGTVVITGMLAATLLAIFLIPLLFVLFEKLAERFSRKPGSLSTETAGRVVGVLLAVVLAATAVGCTMGPDYKRPPVTTPDTFRTAGDPAETTGRSLGDEPWASVFSDETLRSLITEALEKNTDVRIAAARVLQAGAQLGITKADQLPTVTGTVNVQGTHGAIFGGSQVPTIGVVQANVGLSWELDFWGRYRRATEAARADLAATEWGARAVRTSLVSEVSTQYFLLRSLDLQLEIATRTLESRRESLRLTQVREQGGVTSLMDVRQSEQLVIGAEAQITDIQRRIARVEHALSVLLGRTPGPIARGQALLAQDRPLDIPAGLPSSLLERRPDIQQAEQRLAAATARVGVAETAKFPQIGLTASGGVASTSLGDLLSSGTWSVAGNLMQPIFNAGRNRNRVEAAEALVQEQIAAYDAAVLRALREVSDALVEYQRQREMRVSQEALVAAATDARRLAELRYTGGVSSYLEVLDSDTRLFTAQVSLVQAQLAELTAFVEIYRALGGGWQS